MNDDIYLICPVRDCLPEVKIQMDKYVIGLEAEGKKVHYPPRDVDQSLGEYDICSKHRLSMKDCKEVHIWWDRSSTGSHFDLGMAFMLLIFNPYLKIVLANPIDVPETISKSFGNIIRNLSGPHMQTNCAGVN